MSTVDDSSKSDEPTSSQPETTTSPEPEPQASPEPDPQPEPQPEPEPEPEPEPQPNNMCPQMGMVSGAAAQQVIVDQVDWQNDRITLRNLTSAEIQLDGWIVFLGQRLLALEFVSGFVIPPNDVFHVHLREDGTSVANRAYWAGTTADFDLDHYSGDVSVHTSYDLIDSASAVKAYMRWGADPPYAAADHHRDEADAAGVWADAPGSFVQTDAQHVGVVAVGNASSPNGYAAMSAACMP